MRITKEHDERQKEIIEVASNLFLEKGYDNCSVNDIINAVGIAKGTFYYYFKSKEDVLDSAVKQMSDTAFAGIEKIAKDKKITPIDKISKVLFSMRLNKGTDETLIKEINKVSNVHLHQKTLVSILTNLAPVIAEIIMEGNEQGIFSCPYPKQSSLIFLSSALTLLDDGIFSFDDSQKMEILKALLFSMEKMLGVQDNTLSSKMIEFYGENRSI